MRCMTNGPVLLLGGTRFIGPHCVRALREAGYEPVVFHRGQSAWPWPGEAAPAAIRGDRREPGALAMAAHQREWAGVIDLTAFNGADSQMAIAAFNGRCESFVHISTGSVYQVLRGYPNPYAEDDALLFADHPPLADEDPAQPGMRYGLGKRACEEALLTAYEDDGFPVTIIRPPIVSGPLDYTLRDASYLLRLRDGGPLVVPATSGAFRHVSVTDLAELIILALDQWDAAVGEVFNAGGGSILSLTEYLELAAALLGLQEPQIVPLPFEVIEARIGMGSQPFGYPRTAIPDITKAQSVLGWQPARAPESLPAAFDWAEREYQGPVPESYSAYRELELATVKELAGAGVG